MRTVVALAMLSALWMLDAVPALAASAPQKPEAPGVKLPTGVISKREDPVAYLRAHPIDEHALLSNTQNMYRSDKQYYYRNQASQDRCLNNGCCCCLTEHSRNDGDKFMVDGKGKPISACHYMHFLECSVISILFCFILGSLHTEFYSVHKSPNVK